jgi:aminomethyltransferase
MKQTVLHQKHLQAKAKMTDFQGWQVPLQYTDALDEYHAVRAAAGLFDISFLGRIEVTGQGAAAFLQKVFTRNITKISAGSAHYGCICNDAGFVLDDTVLFRFPEGPEDGRYMLSTNAVNTGKILLWLKQHASPKVQIADVTESFAHLSLQGPQSASILETLAEAHFKKLKVRSMRTMTILNTPVLVSRTGYTGEHGYELFLPTDRAEVFWDAVLNAGSGSGILPCGLACRDTLRLEMGYLLYGNDIDETRTPLEAGLQAFVDLKKDFIGKDALVKLKAEGVKQKLSGFVLVDKDVPKAGGSIFSENREIGVVTSGAQSPCMRAGIGLGYVTSRYSQPGQEIEIEVKDREIAAKIVELPFYRKK